MSALIQSAESSKISGVLQTGFTLESSGAESFFTGSDVVWSFTPLYMLSNLPSFEQCDQHFCYYSLET
jgi:hypothetical protein